MSNISTTYETFRTGDYTRGFLCLNHSSDLIFSVYSLSLSIFKIKTEEERKDPSNAAKMFAVTFLVIAIPGMISSAMAIAKDTLLTITYLVTTIVLALATLLTLGRFSLVNQGAKGSAILLLDSTCNIGIDALGVLCPFAGLVLSARAHATFEGLLQSSQDLSSDESSKESH